MDNNKICTARIEHTRSLLLTIIWYVLGAIGFYITTFAISYSEHQDYHRDAYSYWPAHDEIRTNIWGIRYREAGYHYDGKPYDNTYPIAIVFGVLITVLVIALPFIIRAKKRNIAGRCSLELTEDQITGQVKTLFNQRKLQMPIEKLDNIITANGFADKFLRSGETVMVHSTSGAIRFHYVQNAEDFVLAALAQIEKVKTGGSAVIHTAPAAVVSADPAPAAAAPILAAHAESGSAATLSGGDAMEKLSSLKQMLDGGLISQEDFDAKKQDILSKM